MFHDKLPESLDVNGYIRERSEAERIVAVGRFWIKNLGIQTNTFYPVCFGIRINHNEVLQSSVNMLLVMTISFEDSAI